jgi:hypothetical protein
VDLQPDDDREVAFLCLRHYPPFGTGRLKPDDPHILSQ